MSESSFQVSLGMMDAADPEAHLQSVGSTDTDDALVEKRFGLKNEFVREFGSAYLRSHLNTPPISIFDASQGMSSSIATTFNIPLQSGGPASVVWCWAMGSVMNMTLGASIAEIVSAYPTCGGVYSASAWLVPQKYRAITGWVVGLNLLGQVAGVASTEFGLATMIWAAVSVGKDGDLVVTAIMQWGLFAGLLVLHGLLNSLRTRELAIFTKGFVFINIGIAFLVIICLLATTPRSEMQAASYVFGDINNVTGYKSDGIAFLFGLLSVQWTMTDYDAVAHISFEVKRAAIAAPVAIFVAVAGTGVIGWLLNIVLILCSPDIRDLPGFSGQAFIEIMRVRIGKSGTLVLWSFICLVAFFTVQTALQANSRTLYAFSRDHALPDWGFFGRLNKTTQTPLFAVWAVVLFSMALGALNFASGIAVNAIFSMCAVALDISYVIPVIARRIYKNHPEVQFVPGPFYMGETLGLIINLLMVGWTFFECIILSFPTFQPITAQNFNYSWVITLGVMLLSFIWYAVSAHKRYTGPRSDDPVDGQVPVVQDAGKAPFAPPAYGDAQEPDMKKL
ncbi:apc amino acid permease [Phaffia rhodozyma]|uniref:Apc amino acid permease n=1 Tax=Phaffia rhodozyma TaxID=264483 RepID=A0A0F7SPS4_PHARH|nr:apc amino acid permease [Phaffia rhodozyma]